MLSIHYLHDFTLILVVQGSISPPAEKLLVQIHLCINGVDPVLSESLPVSVMGSDHNDKNLEEYEE